MLLIENKKVLGFVMVIVILIIFVMAEGINKFQVKPLEHDVADENHGVTDSTLNSSV